MKDYSKPTITKHEPLMIVTGSSGGIQGSGSGGGGGYADENGNPSYWY